MKTPDEDGRTPLEIAFEKGYQGMVFLLRERGTNFHKNT